MLRWRLLLGVIFVAALVGLMWVDNRTDPPGIVLLPLALALSALATSELLWLVATRDLKPIPWAAYVGNLLIVASNLMIWFEPRWPSVPKDSAFVHAFWPFLAFTLVTLLAVCAEMRRYAGPGAVMERLSLLIFSYVYVGVFLSFACQLRFLAGGDLGLAAIASLVIVVKMCDIGAYTVGRLFGRVKMAPVLSPGKTLEGAAGGLAFAWLGSWATFAYLLPTMTPAASNLPAWGWIVYGLAVGVAGMAGDLAESLIKRDCGRKDSSSWMPGFGGVLDLLDSILFAAPVAYVCWLAML